jgi:serine protease Do
MPVPGFGEVAEGLRRSTVRIEAGGRGHGSGIIVKDEGVIVTNAHVVSLGPLDVQFWDGTRARGELMSRDVGRDLATLSVARTGLPAATLADSDYLRVGELVIAVGNPLGFIGAMTTGVIHAIGRVPGLGATKWIQADVRLAPGNSGGPLADARGRVVGLNTMVARGVGLAIPSNTISRVLSGRSAEAPLGITARPAEIRVDGRVCLGLLVVELERTGAAKMASLMIGDMLIGVDGKAAESIEDFERAMDGSKDGVIRLQFVRGDRTKVRTVAIRLGLPSAAAA